VSKEKEAITKLITAGKIVIQKTPVPTPTVKEEPSR